MQVILNQGGSTAMPHLNPLSIILGVLIVGTILGTIAWFAGRSFFALLERKEGSPGVGFYILFTGAIAGAATGAMVYGLLKFVSFLW
jgi:hypothetical protein